MRRPAFTLAEMVATLAILALTLLIVTPKAIGSYRRWEEQRFYKQLTQEWQQTIARSRSTGLRSEVVFSTGRPQDVQFYYESAEVGVTTKHVLLAPPTIDMQNREGNRYRIERDGFVRPGTVWFDNPATGKRTFLKIQMGGAIKYVEGDIPAGAPCRR